MIFTRDFVTHKNVAESPHSWQKVIIYGNSCIILYIFGHGDELICIKMPTIVHLLKWLSGCFSVFCESACLLLNDKLNINFDIISWYICCQNSLMGAISYVAMIYHIYRHISSTKNKTNKQKNRRNNGVSNFLKFDLYSFYSLLVSYLIIIITTITDCFMSIAILLNRGFRFSETR